MRKLYVTLMLLSLTTIAINAKVSFKGWSWKLINAKNAFVEREENSFICVKDRFYLIGGRGINPVSIYDPKSNSWSEGAKSPIELHHFQAVAYNNLIYVICAQTGKYPHETPVSNIYIYNTKKDSWSVGSEIPVDRRRGSAGTVIYKDVVYLACGIQDGHWSGNVAWFDAFDLKTGIWKKLPDAPCVRDHFEAVVLNDKMYCIGGRKSYGINNQVFDLTIPEIDLFDFKTGTWSTMSTTFPTLRAGCTSVVVGNEILTIGGESIAQKLAHNNVDALNVTNGAYRSLPNLVEGTHGTGALVYKNKIYIAAGAGNKGGSPKLKSLQCFSKD